jgi:alkylation response protein AidB-like acyl-CoA dehydrogenase
MGANGSLRSSPLARLLGGAQLLFQTDGTPEILNLVIGRSLLKSRS